MNLTAIVEWLAGRTEIAFVFRLVKTTGRSARSTLALHILCTHNLVL